ncbi:MAG TPA: DUF1566 domain-containing protein [Leucothrix mucor]|nr:DUF1566 domain-containing protein [Leucothrix mucor]
MRWIYSQKFYKYYKACAEFTVQRRDGLISRMNPTLKALPIGCVLWSNFVAYAVVWSSSPNANNSNNAWNVNFNNGNDNTNNKNNNKQVRLVRSGEWHG